MNDEKTPSTEGISSRLDALASIARSRVQTREDAELIEMMQAFSKLWLGVSQPVKAAPVDSAPPATALPGEIAPSGESPPETGPLIGLLAKQMLGIELPPDSTVLQRLAEQLNKL